MGIADLALMPVLLAMRALCWKKAMVLGQLQTSSWAPSLDCLEPQALPLQGYTLDLGVF